MIKIFNQSQSSTKLQNMYRVGGMYPKLTFFFSKKFSGKLIHVNLILIETDVEFEKSVTFFFFFYNKVVIMFCDCGYVDVIVSWRRFIYVSNHVTSLSPYKTKPNDSNKMK